MRSAQEDGVQSNTRPVWAGLVIVLLGLLAVLQFAGLGHPLFWQDEGETAMFGRRILDHGYPKVHGREGVVYGMGIPLEQAIDVERDAYLGSLWGQYYLAALGVAWSDTVSDPHAKTLRVRLPFVLSGWAGLLLLFVAARRALATPGRSALPGAVLFVGMLCLSTSLLLHLREARYYGPLVFGVGWAVWAQGALVQSRPGRVRVAAAAHLGGALVLLATVFYPAAVAVSLWIVVEAGLALRRRAGPPLDSGPSLVSRLAPVAIAALLAVPLIAYFDVFGLSDAFSERWQFGPIAYLANLFHLTAYLLRFEFLGWVLVAEAALLATRTSGSAGDPARRLSASLLRLVGVYAAVGALNPIFFERYFVPVGPLLALIFVLDCASALARAAAPGLKAVARARRGMALTLGILFAVTVAIRWPELSGRAREIVHPVRGPVDVVVADLIARHAVPAELLIATNYEAEPYMFYLGSRVVGRFHSGREAVQAAERDEAPDVVVLRTGQGRRLEDVRAYLRRGGFERVPLSVADTPYNQLPELYPGFILDHTHWFETPRPGRDGPPIALYERRADAS